MQSFRVVEAQPPYPKPPAAGGFAPSPPLASGDWGPTPKTVLPHCEFLATRLSTSYGLRAKIVWLFLVFTYIWQKDFAKISKVPGA